ncbi:MAG: UTP--glucose-phosphate uridylyltransferase [Bacteriovoracaceae bacterium]|nr:UTP--glucose-phosphate uridylyltransferase [Bacteriovoracaceae bacterium]
MLSTVIPVAGLGTRSLPASKVIPKEMLPVFDRPIIQYIVEESIQSGASNIIFVTSKGKTAIEDHFDISFELEHLLERTKKTDLYKGIHALSREISIQSVRQKEQLGLGHAVLMAKNLIHTGPFGVLLGDDMIDSNPAGLKQLTNTYDLVKKNQAADIGVVMLSEVPDSEVSKYGICEIKSGTDFQITRCVEKPQPHETKSRFAILGRYLLPLDTFEILESQSRGALGEIQLTDALNALAKQGRLFGCVLKGQRFDAGDRLGFLKANIHYYLKSPMAQDVKNFLKEILK